MSDVFFDELGLAQPKYHLGIGGGTHGQNTGRMIEAIEAVLMKEWPDWVLVYGDTDSTLAGALAAVKLHIPVAHVEPVFAPSTEECRRKSTVYLLTMLQICFLRQHPLLCQILKRKGCPKSRFIG